MQTSVLAHISFVPKESSSSSQFSRIGNLVGKAPKFGWLCFLGFSIASMSVGMVAHPAIAQSWDNSSDCNRSSSWRGTPPKSGFVSTNTGIGLNIRCGPGLDFAIIDGVSDGTFLKLTGQPVFADGYRWRRVTTGGWVATEFVEGHRWASGCSSGSDWCGSSPQPLPQPLPPQQPIFRPIPPQSFGPYVVAVPATNRFQLEQIRRIVPNARPDQAPQGSFINAGGFQDLNSAKSLSYLLRSYGLDARVIYR